MFEKLNETCENVITCADKDSVLNTSGVGKIKLISGRGKEIEINNVLYSKDLTGNLLSLRKFLDHGMQI